MADCDHSCAHQAQFVCFKGVGPKMVRRLFETTALVAHRYACTTLPANISPRRTYTAKPTPLSSYRPMHLLGNCYLMCGPTRPYVHPPSRMHLLGSPLVSNTNSDDTTNDERVGQVSI